MNFARVATIQDAYLKTEIDKTVSPKDHMYNTGPDWYFIVGLDGIRVILRSLALSACNDVKRILDLPCGHGRVGRHLRAAFPQAEIAFADIDRDGADFCATHFRGTRAERWLRHLCGCLSRRGILVATVHGNWSKEVQAKYGAMIGPAEWQEIMRGYEATGWGYARYAGPDDYGVSLCQAAAVIAMAGRVEGVRILSYHERGWAGNHDVLVIDRWDRMEPW
jgi:hypothetical protein